MDIEYIDFLLIRSFDAGLMAQNALTTAESMGLGGGDIGAVRANINELPVVLGLPKYLIPLVGLCIGHSAGDKPELKPRLPQSMVLIENQYQSLDQDKIATYDEKMLKYYEIDRRKPLSA
ncbi:hypothetical protein [Paenibacillus sp. FSL E2-0178]|uniref:hypothetical protein n=1 Tax=Paenibacillus sp. FSL E2-0178 TaxID=2921361 RepID=UPI0031585D1D